MELPINASWNLKKLLNMRSSVYHLVAGRDRLLSTKQIWEDMLSMAPKVAWHHLVWFSGLIPNHFIILWMAILDRLPTRARLLRMGITIENVNCLFCNMIPETQSHIFFECDYAKSLWASILQLCDINRNICHWDGELAWAVHCFRGKSLLTRVLKLAFTSYVYGIWRERNNKLFGGKTRTMIENLEDIKDTIRIRMSGWRINMMDLRNAAICARWGIA
ncbi:hypothetical protein F3Y22_tig00111550pilonHSYRG00032 [Hibiscus syriacus]|uniref:Reverse transcriptase zinc-binding domain-containing protein n=2 Tax=Hibiscus syriacus TaxID=106335 RepID=A0A6A2YDV7_HIBSY|nr:hypothetical protein F3Y22_tig00111550pilonHSYRG00032 [Hibiscus syriacus]